jgi:hypothetical protein
MYPEHIWPILRTVEYTGFSNIVNIRGALKRVHLEGRYTDRGDP